MYLKLKKTDFLLLKNNKNRNNYIASQNLAGSIQLTEKYILCLNHYASEFEENPPKKLLAALSNQNLKILISNPCGLIIAGTSKDFDVKQRSDFELIRRQFRNIADFITNDDLLTRLDNTILQLSSQTDLSSHNTKDSNENCNVRS